MFELFSALSVTYLVAVVVPVLLAAAVAEFYA